MLIGRAFILDSVLATDSVANLGSSFHVKNSDGHLDCIGPYIHMCQSNSIPGVSQRKVDDRTVPSFETIQ